MRGTDGKFVGWTSFSSMTICCGSFAPVRERGADVEAQQLDQQRERVRERQVEVGQLVVLDGARRLRHREDRAVVAVREDAALRRAGRPGRVDDRVGIVGFDGGDAAIELGAIAPAAARAHIGERDRVGGRALGVDHDHVLEGAEGSPAPRRSSPPVRRPRRRRVRVGTPLTRCSQRCSSRCDSSSRSADC